MSSSQEPQTKQFQKGERSIPHPSQQAKKYYPAEDVAQPKKVLNPPHIHQTTTAAAEDGH